MRVPLLSSEMFKTLIVTAQGAQVACIVVSGLLGSDNISATFLDSLTPETIFLPLAAMGLLRLICTFWLTNGYAYAMTPTVNIWETTRPRVFAGGASTAHVLDNASAKATWCVCQDATSLVLAQHGVSRCFLSPTAQISGPARRSSS